MMPFSILRMWGLGLVGWFVLGVAVYCGWQAVREYRSNLSPITVEPVRQRQQAPVAEAATGEVMAEEHALSDPPRNLSNRFWALFATTLVLGGWSFGGFLPLRWLLHNPTGPRRESPITCRELWLDRPDGTRLHVQIRGPDNAPTILLTHGWSLDVSAWDYVINRLAAKCRVVTWDLPGLGQSRGPSNRDWSLEEMAYDLNAVLQATTTRAPVVLAGHSIGGMITQVFCRLQRQQLGSSVQGIALLHTTYTNPLRTCFANRLATALEWPLITPFNYLAIALAPLVWLSNWQSYLNGSLHLSARLSSFSGKQTWQQLDHAALLAVKAWPGVLGRGNLSMQTFNEETTLSELDLPVLVLSGQHDRMTLPSASSHMVDLLPDDRPCQLPSNHLGMWECPDQFAAVLTQFAENLAVRKPRSATTPVTP